MNQNMLIAVLQAKGIINEDEAYKLVDFLSNSPVPSYYKDAQAAVKKLLAKK